MGQSVARKDAQANETPEAIKAMAEVGKEARTNKRLQPHRFRLNDSTQFENHFDVVPEAGTTFDDMLAPMYWEHVARQMKPWDHVQVRAEDGTFYAQLIVQQADRLSADVRPIMYAELTVGAPSDGDVPSGYSVDWGGPVAGWRVLMGNTVVRDGFLQRGAAIQWVVNRGKATK